MVSRATRPGGRTARVRAQVLDAVVELVARDGLGGLRYEAVAERSGVHKTSVYRNWPTREELVRDALARYGEQLVPVPDSGDLRADLVEFLCSLAAALDTPAGRAIDELRRLGAPEFPQLRPVLDEVRRARQERLDQRFRRAVEAGELPAADVEFLNGPLAGSVRQYVVDGTFSRERVERLVDVLLAGLRAEGERTRGQG